MKYIIQLEKCIVILTSQEINTLLQKDTEIFKTALKRGKYYLRKRTQCEREVNQFEWGQSVKTALGDSRN